MELAKAVVRAKAPARTPLTQEQKDRQKHLNQVRTEKRLAENLAQRALIESKRA